MSKSKRTYVRAEVFIPVWQKAKSRAEAAKKLGLSVRNASARACLLRAKGVDLKKFWTRGGVALDYKALAKLAKESAQ